MRPLELTFSGLRSYRDTTTIDFTPLDLFAVIGDTGAGKSTIIEALSLALYAKKSWTGGPAGLADMIADGVNTMRVQLRFHADGHDWIVTRARHRNASAPVDKLTSPTGGGPNVDGARPVTQRVTELVGLDHDQFTRAVVLPQGRFDLLLRAGERERTEILSSILGLGDITATRAQVEQVRGAWSERAVEARVQRGHLPPDPQAELAAAMERAAQAVARLAALQGARDAAVAAHREASRSGLALERVQAAYVAVPAVTGDPVAELQAVQRRAVALRRDQRTAAAAAATADAALGTIDGRIDVVRDGFATRDRMAAALHALGVLAQSVDKDRDRQTSLEQDLAAHRAAVPAEAVAATLVAAEGAATAQVEAATAALLVAERARREAADAWHAHAAALDLLTSAAAAVVTAEEPMAELADALAAAVDGLAAAEQQLAAATSVEREALVAGAVAAVAAGCGAGDDCPVCAQPLPAGYRPPHPPDLAVVEAARDAASTAVAERRAAHGHASRAADQAAHRVADAQARRESAMLTTAERRRVAAALGIDVDAPEGVALGPFDDTVRLAAAAVDDARRGEQVARQALTVAVTRLDEARRAHAERAAAIGAELEAARARSAEHAAFVERLPPPWRPDLERSSVETVRTRLEDALDALDVIEGERELARRAAADGHAEVQAFDGLLSREVAMPAARIVAALDQRGARLGELAAAVAASGDDNGPVDGPDAIGDPDVDPEGLDALVDGVIRHLDRAQVVMAAADDVLTSLRATSARATAELAAALHAAGVADVDTLHAALGRAESDVAVTADVVAAAAAAVTAAAHLDEVRAVLEPFVANLKVLAIALRDQHFVAHLVRARETELLAEATRRLKDITGGRFGFTTGFGVVNVASGEVRTPDTLSGGERFQAALALALGLVEIASRGGGKLDAVFVDEGFGSLDSSALDTALDTLGKVASGGKMVALISHLRPVAEYVDTVLHVTRDDVLGSRIEVLDSEAREQLLADDIRSGLTA